SPLSSVYISRAPTSIIRLVFRDLVELVGINWTRKVSNEEVLRRVNQRREVLHTIKIRKVVYLGHVLRQERYELVQLIMMVKVAARRDIVSRKKSWLYFREWTGIASAAELFRLAKNRQEFTFSRRRGTA
ncbi:jg2370, partial [Pararge aegeria aegeria]